MKKILCVVSMVLTSGLFVFGQMKITDKYEFPVKSGTEEWKQFETIEKRIAALQIPEDVLTRISTEGLLETCLEFPYLLDILHGNHMQHGFEALMTEFNGFRELFKHGAAVPMFRSADRAIVLQFHGIVR